ncbi:MAG: DUF3854 domain-containing protein [Polyangiaceae bacterium]
MTTTACTAGSEQGPDQRRACVRTKARTSDGPDAGTWRGNREGADGEMNVPTSQSTPDASVELEASIGANPDDKTDVGADEFCRTYLRDHGISLEYARECDLRAVPDGWNKMKARPVIGGLFIPYPGKLWRLRRRSTHVAALEEAGTVIRDGYEVSKFTLPQGAEVAPYFPPSRMPEEWQTNVGQPLFFAEGPFKALCLTEHGLPCIGLGGVEAGAHDAAVKREEGALELHPALGHVAWTGRMVFVAFDAFRTRTTGVARGEARLAYILGRAGARVYLVELPPDSRMGRDEAAYMQDQRDQGPDDFIRRHGAEALIRLAIRFTPADPVERLRALLDADAARHLLDDLTFQAALHVGGPTTVAAVVSVLKRQFKLDLGKTAVDEKIDEFRRRDSRRRAASAEDRGGSDVCANEYVERDGRTCLVVRHAKLGTRYRQLANFTATITKEVTEDDGVTVSKLFTVAGKLSNGVTLPTASVRSAEWNDRTWVTENWGARAVVEAGRDSWGHTVAAIQKASSPVTAVTYTATGWRKIGDGMAYLFPGGSVGSSDADVRNPDDGGRYGFPTGDATKERVASAISRSLDLISIGEAGVTVPALSAAYTAPLASILEVDFGVWMAGESGSRKSGLTALVGCHFGKFTYCSLPASWTSTVNALESFLFRAKDTLGLIDNYIPCDREAAAKVNRIVQQIGDRASRARLTKTSDAMPSRPPRGLMLATGEDVPVGSSDSTVGRLVVVRVKGGDLPVENIIAASQDADDYSIAMRAYLEWFGADYETRAAAVRRHREKLIEQFAAVVTEHAVHPRTARNVATLGAGLMAFLRFAQETAAITSERYEEIRISANRALVQVARAQASFRENATPVQRYLSTLRALLLQGTVTLSGRYEDLDRERGVGWQGDTAFVFLHPDLTWRAIELFHAQSAQKWPFSKTGMHQALIDGGIVHRAEAGKADAKRSVGLERTSIRVLLVHRAYLADAIPARVDYDQFTDGDDTLEIPIQ